MRERKYVKFRVDMYDDIKFKIIDMKPERDLIHYIWTRLLTLAGKVNLEGNLYVSRNIPYTIETLAIEFNIDIEQIKLALDVFIELEMIQFTEDNIYRVSNFVKHQNIKVKEKINCKDKDNPIKNKEVEAKDDFKNQIYDNKAKECENEISQNEVGNVRNNVANNLEITPENITKADDNISKNNITNSLQDNTPILLETKRKRKRKKDNVINVTDEDPEDDSTVSQFIDGEIPLVEGDVVLEAWSF